MFCHILVAGSFLICFHYFVIRLDIFITNTENGHIHLGEVIRLGAVLAGMLITNKFFINYFYSNKNKFYPPTPKKQIKNFVIIALCDIVVAYSLQYMLSVTILPRDFFVRQYVIAFLLNIIVVYGLYYFFIMVNSLPENKRTFIIVGSNKRAVKFAYLFESNNILGFYNLGYIDNENFSGEDIKILGKLKNYAEIVRNTVVDVVVVALPIRSYYDDIMEVVAISERHGICVHYLANIFEPKHSHVTASKIGALSSIIMYTAPLEDWRMLTKRFFDVIFSIILIFLTLPIMVIIAVAIKLGDNGDVLFRQPRVGYNKRIFKVYKFRTMCKDADKMQDKISQLNEMDGPVFKIKNDPRISPFGRFLRKYSLDELPQLFNVLKGDMSIVGPRPMPLGDYKGFSEDWHRRRFSMRPGLTCYWQVRGRNALPFETWMRFDMEYIDNWNLFEDLKIILLTIPEVLRGGGM